jgi:putative phage-type endonuclease
MDEPFKRTRYDTEEEWHKLRSQCIGGSDAAAIVGCNPWKTSVDLYKIKKGLITEDDIQNREAVIYGKNTEEPIRNIFAQDYDGILQVNYSKEHLTRNTIPFLGASLDGELNALEDFEFRSFDIRNEAKPFLIKKGMRGILEIKTTEFLSSMSREKWTDKVPQNYYIQTLHYGNVTLWDFVIYKALIRYEYNHNKFTELREYGYLLDESRQADRIDLYNQEWKWWNQYFLINKEPPLTLPSI